MSQFLLCIIVLRRLMMYSIYNLGIVESLIEDAQGIKPANRPSDFNFSGSNAQLVTRELTSLNKTEIKDYPLTDLPVGEIKRVFHFLDGKNVAKVLLNLPVNDIKKIQKQLSDDEFNSILNRLYPNERNIVIKNMNYTSYK